MPKANFYKWRGRRIEEYLQWGGFVSPGVAYQRDGGFLTIFKIQPVDLGSEDDPGLLAFRERQSAVIKSYHDHWGFWFIGTRYSAPHYPTSDFRNEIAKLIDDETRAIVTDKSSTWEIDLWLAVINLPPADADARMSDIFVSRSDPNGEAPENSYRRYHEIFRAKTDVLATLLSEVVGPTRRATDDEFLTLLHHCYTGRRVPLAAPRDTQYFITDTVVAAPLEGGFAPRQAGRHIRVIGVRAYPTRTVPRMLRALQTLPCAWVWSVRWLPASPAHGKRYIGTLAKYWFQKRQRAGAFLQSQWSTGPGHASSGGSKAEGVLEDEGSVDRALEIKQTAKDVDADRRGFGQFTLTITVAEESELDVNENAKAVVEILEGLGFAAHIEEANAIEAFLGSLPGQPYQDTRRPIVSTASLADMIPTDAPWSGPIKDTHLNEPTTTMGITPEGTIVRVSLHVSDTSNHAIIGATGAGKSFFMGVLASQWLRHQDSRYLLYDKGRSNFVLTQALGYTYYDFGGANNPPLQPLRDIDQQAELHWVSDWLWDIALLANVSLAPTDRQDLWQTLQSVARLPKNQRTFTALWTMTQNERLKPIWLDYTQNGKFGAWMDHAHENLAIDRWTVFEVGRLLESTNYTPIIAYLLHVADRALDGRPTLIQLDEAWKGLRHPVIAPKIEDWARSIRGRNGGLGITTQSAEDDTEIANFGNVLFECTQTRFFLPNHNARTDIVAASYRKKGLTDREIRAIAEMPAKRSIYYSSPLGKRWFQLPVGPISKALIGPTPRDQMLDIADGLLKQGVTPGREFARAYLSLAHADLVPVFDKYWREAE